ncbi:hydroxyacyl-thioester dehydratase type 2, mitochondrial-like [Amphiura filiformis]|uniref:hydroxyacyl-thioester dehydratase type 2, mitochondrial-like n=1 Tax=Amphiura filiformis TaxID=82378 RepID=UPI003B20E64A
MYCACLNVNTNMILASKVGYFARNHALLRVLCLKRQLRSSSHQRFSFKVGDTAEVCKTFSASDVRIFADLTGDKNPLHVDDDYAKTTRFGRCIVHGVLTNGLLSAVLATKLPGPGALFLSQDIEFPAPLYIDEPVVARVQIAGIDGRRINCHTTCVAKDTQKIVMTGTVKLFMMKDAKLNT